MKVRLLIQFNRNYYLPNPLLRFLTDKELIPRINLRNQQSFQNYNIKESPKRTQYLKKNGCLIQYQAAVLKINCDPETYFTGMISIITVRL
jgi:hypothetical protein